MGFQLFTASGTFNPASWGLKAGDMLHIICVGGGGGGSGVGNTNTVISVASSSAAGSSGSASSFGSIVSAAGGGGGSAYGATQSTIGQFLGGVGKGYNCSNIVYDGGNYILGGYGAGGWYPGMLRAQHRISPNDKDSACYAGMYDYAALSTPNAVSSSDGFINGVGGKGGKGYNNSGAGCPASSGPGGGGYGAGGGGAVKCYNYNNQNQYSWGGYGGNSGVVKQIDYALPNTNAIAVTVGSGGAGGKCSTDMAQGGAGASGCVAVYW